MNRTVIRHYDGNNTRCVYCHKPFAQLELVSRLPNGMVVCRLGVKNSPCSAGINLPVEGAELRRFVRRTTPPPEGAGGRTDSVVVEESERGSKFFI